MDVVVFDPQEFREIYPEFDKLSDAQLNQAFGVASILCDNTAAAPVSDLTIRKTLLYLLVCHLCALQSRGSGVVGTLTSASEGSISSGFTLPQNINATWYNQTQCGATYWQLTVPYRTGRYIDASFRHRW